MHHHVTFVGLRWLLGAIYIDDIFLRWKFIFCKVPAQLSPFSASYVRPHQICTEPRYSDCTIDQLQYMPVRFSSNLGVTTKIMRKSWLLKFLKSEKVPRRDVFAVSFIGKNNEHPQQLIRWAISASCWKNSRTSVRRRRKSFDRIKREKVHHHHYHHHHHHHHHHFSCNEAIDGHCSVESRHSL